MPVIGDVGFQVIQRDSKLPDLWKYSIHFNVVYRKLDWWTPKLKSLNSMSGFENCPCPCNETFVLLLISGV